VIPLFRATRQKIDREVRSTFFVSDPSFLSGVARTLDLWGQLDEYNIGETPEEADALALRTDWTLVGHDIVLAAKAHQRFKPVKRGVSK
jgi:hypothetical protein